MSAKSQQNRLFAAAQRAKLLRQTPTTPTGVIFEWGGIEFDLMPVAFGTLLDASETIEKAAALYKRAGDVEASAGGTSVDLIVDGLQLLGTEAPQFICLVRDHLAKSPGVVPEDHQEDREVYEEWFRAQDAAGMLRKLLPMLREVIGSRPLPSAASETPTQNLTLVEMEPNAST